MIGGASTVRYGCRAMVRCAHTQPSPRRAHYVIRYVKGMFQTFTYACKTPPVEGAVEGLHAKKYNPGGAK
jgi:hypothetical protein